MKNIKAINCLIVRISKITRLVRLQNHKSVASIYLNFTPCLISDLITWVRAHLDDYFNQFNLIKNFMGLPIEYLNMLRAIKTSLLEVDMMYYSKFSIEDAHMVVEKAMGYGSVILNVLENNLDDYSKNTEYLMEFKINFTEFENALFKDIVPGKI